MFTSRPLRPLFGPSAAEPAEPPGGPDLAPWQDLFDAHCISLVSARCCNPATQADDEALAAAITAALQAAGSPRRLVQTTLTRLRQQLRTLGPQAPAKAAVLGETLMRLFQSQGLQAFPLVILHGRVVFYGGVPSAEAISQRLQQPGSAHA